VGLERRQPSQDFGLIIADGNVMTILHVESVAVVGKRTIKISGAFSIRMIPL